MVARRVGTALDRAGLDWTGQDRRHLVFILLFFSNYTQ